MTGPRFSREEIERSLYVAGCSIDEVRDVLDPRQTPSPSRLEWVKALDRVRDAATRVAYARRYLERKLREEGISDREVKELLAKVLRVRPLAPRCGGPRTRTRRN